MKKHMYLRILWPYFVGLVAFIVFYLSSQSITDFIGDSPFALLFLSWLFFSLPLIVSVIILIKDYRNCSKSQKIVCISLNSLTFISVILSGVIYYNFITTFKLPMM